ncbi:MAG: AMP-binding protein [Deltaproteobacteria bacterium]|nr:AMP-binding protein [Deltaproteobacteria bacterium]
MYGERFWKRNWDEGLTDLEPSAFETTYVDLIKPIFEERPDKTALGYLGVDVTFGELDGYSNQFANMLLENGFRKGDIVGINLPNTPEYVIALIGTLKAGCVVSGVSPLMSAPQVQYQMSDLGGGERRLAFVTLDAAFSEQIAKIAPEIPELAVVITTSVAGFLPSLKRVLGKLTKKIPSGKVTPLAGKTVLDFHRDVLGRHSTDAPGVKLAPDDLGYVQYTGGTTGAPKGAMLSHRNAAHNIMSVIRWLGWEETEGVVLSGFPMFHVAGLTMAECTIYVGWTQVLVPNPRDTDHICKEMVKYGVTNLVNVPSLYQMLMANPSFRKMDHSKLGTCVCAASPFPKKSQEELESIIGKGKVLELYGMTETSPVSAMNPMKAKRKLGTIGVPFLNVEAKLLDPDTGEEAPLGEAGEICIRGPMVMQGYYGRPEETRRAIDRNGYMHTGDVAIMDEDGFMRLVDRTKDMINVGGYKVFSSKVEETLARHPAIDMIALVGVENPQRPGSELVKAFLQLDPGHGHEGDENALKQDIIRFAKESCSPYEVPRVIEIIGEMPLTAVGKIDKKLLRKKKA